jgi:hypothetical protein
MFHLVARSIRGTLLFHTWGEAYALWERIAGLGPTVALALMPDHLHLVARSIDPRAWNGALSGYARWRNAVRREGGPVFAPSPPPEEIPNRQHLERTIRYVHLNPCRARLVADPLAWPFSTHRDAVGLALRPVRAPESDPDGFHASVSGDRSVALEGTLLPARGTAAPSPAQILDAASALARVPLGAVAHHRPARALAIHALRAEGMGTRAVGALFGVSHVTVLHAPTPDRRVLQMLARVAGDPRFPGLEGGRLRFRPRPG